MTRDEWIEKARSLLEQCDRTSLQEEVDDLVWRDDFEPDHPPEKRAGPHLEMEHRGPYRSDRGRMTSGDIYLNKDGHVCVWMPCEHESVPMSCWFSPYGAVKALHESDVPMIVIGRLTAVNQKKRVNQHDPK